MTTRWLLSACLVWTFAGIPFSGVCQEDSSFSRSLVRILNPSLNEEESRLQSLRAKLNELPPLSPGHSGDSKGFHSRFQDAKDSPIFLEIDFGEVHPVDRIAVFPVQGMFRGSTIVGYGFPEHFLIEFFKDEDFSEPVALLDSKDAPPQTRPDYPTQFVLEKPVEARFLRLQVLEHWTREDGEFLSAFGEIMALSQGHNVALRAKVKANSFTTLPDWFLDHLVDGQTDLGLPVSPEPSPSNGFLSKTTLEPDTDKWVQLELPQSVPVDKVVLIPAQPIDAPDQFGHGFPTRFRLSISETPNFETSTVIADFSEEAYPNPGDNPATFQAENVSARYVKLEVFEMGPISGGRFGVTMAEMQVIEDAQNVAISSRVTASDVFVMERFLHVWRPEYLVDGYSSQNRLIQLQDWLKGMEKRRETEWELGKLETSITNQAERTLGFILGGAFCLAIGSVGIIAMMLVRRKRALAQQQESLRARIARDLHDDLGSRLGGMRLLSESLLNAEELPESFRPDLDLLHRSSGEATDAMRDIVWLLDTRERSLEKLRQQLKLLVPSILGSLPWEFHVDGAPDAEVDFEFRRQTVLAFRESLNNAARHSGGTKFECRVGGDETLFWFEVRDDGKGFDEATIKKGLGLNNLKKRSEALDGSVSIKSQAGKGTVIRFAAPYHRSKQHQLP